MDTILDFGRAYVVVENALPVIRETRKMPRAYVCNVIYTLVGDPFKDWVLKSCKDRNDRIQMPMILPLYLILESPPPMRPPPLSLRLVELELTCKFSILGKAPKHFLTFLFLHLG